MASVKTSEWNDILGHMRITYPELVRGWFAGLEPSGVEQGVLTVRAGNASQVRYLDQECRIPFIEAAQAATGMLVSVQFETDQVEAPPCVPLSFERDSAELKLKDDYTFDNFVAGPCNRLAHAAALAVSESPGRAYNPLFLHGHVGLGKTHLLQAVCHAVRERGPERKVLYISSETFTNHFVEAIEQGALNQFRYRYRHVDLLVIDDIQFLGERERSQEEFFHTFNTLHQAQKQILVCADCCPADIPSFEERLISRFNSGLVALVDRPCLETRMAIVRKKARMRCIEVAEEVVKLVASRIETNIRELEGALVKIDALSQTRDGVINLELARDALGSAGGKRSIAIPEIIEAVADRYTVKLSDLQSRRRTKSISLPRQICMYLARELTSHSLEEIGGFLGGRDHSTVLHGTRLVEDLRASKPEFDREVQDLSESLTRWRAARSSL